LVWAPGNFRARATETPTASPPRPPLTSSEVTARGALALADPFRRGPSARRDSGACGMARFVACRRPGSEWCLQVGGEEKPVRHPPVPRHRPFAGRRWGAVAPPICRKKIVRMHQRVGMGSRAARDSPFRPARKSEKLSSAGHVLDAFEELRRAAPSGFSDAAEQVRPSSAAQSETAALRLERRPLAPEMSVGPA